MGFLDKVKEKANSALNGAKEFAKTTARINNKSNFYGYVNAVSGVVKMDPGMDFPYGCYVSIEDGKGVIYHSSASFQEYVFEGKDIKNFKFTGENPTRSESDGHGGTRVYHMTRFDLEFHDGKKCKADILSEKVEPFKTFFEI